MVKRCCDCKKPLTKEEYEGTPKGARVACCDCSTAYMSSQRC